MSAAKSTPGPWRVDGDDIVSADGTHVVCFGHDYGDYGGIGANADLMGTAGGEKHSDEWLAPYRCQQGANARLIAAAPELLEALMQTTIMLHGCMFIVIDDEARRLGLERCKINRDLIAKVLQS